MSSFKLAWPSLKDGSFAWRPQLRPLADQLRAELDAVEPEAFTRAVEAEMRRRVESFMTGVEAYRDHRYHRDPGSVPVVWQQGSTRLLDYSPPGATGVPVLVVPSLVNRAYILDLRPRRSFMRYLAKKGLHPFLVDWDGPGPAEIDFGLEDYVTGRLDEILDVMIERVGSPMVVGYCMGGLLTLALGLLRQDDIQGLVMLATPWDFHRPDTTQSRMMESLRTPLEDVIRACGEMPVDLLQTFFSLVEPGSIERKFRNFAALASTSTKAREFVSLEDWVNDGVPLTAKVARETLFGWYVDNLPASGTWRVGGRLIRPEEFRKPALAVIPAKDRIVPPASAEVLADALPNATKRIVAAGHIGMIVGAGAVPNVYGYVARWLVAKATGRIPDAVDNNN